MVNSTNIFWVRQPLLNTNYLIWTTNYLICTTNFGWRRDRTDYKPPMNPDLLASYSLPKFLLVKNRKKMVKNSSVKLHKNDHLKDWNPDLKIKGNSSFISFKAYFRNFKTNSTNYWTEIKHRIRSIFIVRL